MGGWPKVERLAYTWISTWDSVGGASGGRQGWGVAGGCKPSTSGPSPHQRTLTPGGPEPSRTGPRPNRRCHQCSQALTNLYLRSKRVSRPGARTLDSDFNRGTANAPNRFITRACWRNGRCLVGCRVLAGGLDDRMGGCLDDE